MPVLEVTTHVATLLSRLPIQLKRTASNFDAVPPISGSSGTVCTHAPSAVPSLGAML